MFFSILISWNFLSHLLSNLYVFVEFLWFFYIEWICRSGMVKIILSERSFNFEVWFLSIHPILWVSNTKNLLAANKNSYKCQKKILKITCRLKYLVIFHRGKYLKNILNSPYLINNRIPRNTLLVDKFLK